MAKEKAGSIGSESCREYNVANLDVLEAVAGDSRGRKEERIDLVVTCIAAIVRLLIECTQWLR